MDRLPEIRRQLDALIERILAELPARRVILHGSFAKGGVHQGSDIDLIVVADFEERFFDRVDRIHPLNTDRLPISVLCYTPDEFERMRAEGNPFLREAVRAGRIHGEQGQGT
jgi:predicted nucleotidyltransferase